MQIIELGGYFGLGDMVLYHHDKGWIPAVVETIFPSQTKKDAPDVALVCLISGMHGSSYSVAAAKHGKDKGQWLTRDEVIELFERQEDERQRLIEETEKLTRSNETARMDKMEWPHLNESGPAKEPAEPAKEPAPPDEPAKEPAEDKKKSK